MCLYSRQIISRDRGYRATLSESKDAFIKLTFIPRPFACIQIARMIALLSKTEYNIKRHKVCKMMGREREGERGREGEKRKRVWHGRIGRQVQNGNSNKDVVEIIEFKLIYTYTSISLKHVLLSTVIRRHYDE